MYFLTFSDTLRKLKIEYVAVEQENNNMRQHIDIMNTHLNEQESEMLTLQQQLENASKDRDYFAIEASVDCVCFLTLEKR